MLLHIIALVAAARFLNVQAASSNLRPNNNYDNNFGIQSRQLIPTGVLLANPAVSNSLNDYAPRNQPVVEGASLPAAEFNTQGGGPLNERSIQQQQQQPIFSSQPVPYVPLSADQKAQFDAAWNGQPQNIDFFNQQPPQATITRRIHRLVHHTNYLPVRTISTETTETRNIQLPPVILPAEVQVIDYGTINPARTNK